MKKDKTLVAYYSLTGNNKGLARKIKAKLGCKILEIRDKKERTGWWNFIISGYQALTRKETKLAPIKQDISSYQQIVLLSPLWAGMLPPATRTFLRNYKDRVGKLYFISLSKAGKENEKGYAHGNEIFHLVQTQGKGL